jgi:lipopolysaccharide biosynthesis glycosyltransferase
MFWFTALNEPFPQFRERNDAYRTMLKVALVSQRLNAPGLKPVLIYNGKEERFHDEIRALGCEVVFHTLSFEADVLAQPSRADLWKDVARGAFLRLDIPELFPALGEALYTDLDVMFLKDPTRYSLKTETIALAPEFDIENFDAVNTGAMLFNCRGARQVFKEVIQFSKASLINVPDYDQGAIRLCLKGRWDRLSPLMNWKPYWGENKEAVVVHFHGPKPTDFQENRKSPPFKEGVYKALYDRAPASYNEYLRIWNRTFQNLM